MQPKPAWKIYVLVIAAMVPTFLAWVFSLTVLFPKFELLWDKFGPEAEGRQVPAPLAFIISFSRFMFNNFTFALGGLVLVLVLLEINWKTWPRWRATSLCVMTIVVNASVMLALLLMTTLALLVISKALVSGSESL